MDFILVIMTPYTWSMRWHLACFPKSNNSIIKIDFTSSNGGILSLCYDLKCKYKQKHIQVKNLILATEKERETIFSNLIFSNLGL